jgi:hypothetical protein
MSELLTIPGGVIVIESEMRVIPRCGSCFEPLFTYMRWQAICDGADKAVMIKQPKDEVLTAVIELVGVSLQTHVCLRNIIEEEP